MASEHTHDPERRRWIKSAGIVGLGALAAGAIGSLPAGAADDIPLAPPDRQPNDLKLPEVVERKIGYAIVGLGQLALEEIMPAFGRCKYAYPAALVSGHPDKAKRVAKAYGVPDTSIYDYQSYGNLADNKNVDVIYIVLPNSMHAEYTIRGFEAGKHVLCEKPMAANVDEARAMIAAGAKASKRLMIAYRLQYEPHHLAAIELCRSGKLGTLKTIAASNCQTVQAPNIRLSAKLAGGPLGDIGVYCLNACRYLSGEEPLEVSAMRYRPAHEPRFREVPESYAFTLRFPKGLLASCDCSFDSGESRVLRAHGTKGYLHLDNAFAYRGLELTTKLGEERRATIQPVDHFAAEMDAFAQSILKNEPIRTPGEEGLADMLAMRAIEEAAEMGRAVKVSDSA